MDEGDRLVRTRAAYDAIAPAYLKGAADRRRLRSRMESFAAQLSERGPLLDLGAGPGWDAAELVGLGAQVIALDFSAAMLRVARERYPGPRVQSDMRRLPFRDASFAGVWANASLLHIPREELAQVLLEVRRVLKPGGLLYASFKQGRQDGYDAKYSEPRWYSYWDAHALDALLARCGFELVERSSRSSSDTTWLMRIAKRL